MNQPLQITLCEVGLRDGLQNEAVCIDTNEKISLVRSLIAAGFKVIEVGSFMHPKAVPQMADTDAVFKALGDLLGLQHAHHALAFILGPQRTVFNEFG